MRIVRTYARMDLGGVENAVLQYLDAHGPDTSLLITHAEGFRAPQARATAGDYRFLGAPDAPPRLVAMVDAMRGAELVHVHAINHDPLPLVAAQLAGVPVAVQTLHNHFTPRTEVLADHTICVGQPLMALLAEPGHASVIPNGVPCPEVLPPFRPWYETGRPLRVLELRRPDKEMTVALADVATSGVFATDEVDLRVGGFVGDVQAPNLTWLGPLDDPSAELAAADLVFHVSRFDTFGRVVYEAMAHGALPVASDLPVFRHVFADEQECLYLRTTDPAAAARQLQTWAAQIAADPERHAARRQHNHERVRTTFTPQAMVARTDTLVAELRSKPRPARSFHPADLQQMNLERVGRVLDCLLYGPSPNLSELQSLRGRAAGLAAYLLVAVGRIPDPDLQVTLLTQAERLLGPRPATSWLLAQALETSGRRAEAVSAMLRAAEQRPGLVRAWLLAATLLVELGQPRAAADVTRTALRFNPHAVALQDARIRLQA